MTVTDSAATLIPGPVLPKDGDRFAAWLADINWAKLFRRGETSITKASTQRTRRGYPRRIRFRPVCRSSVGKADRRR